MRQSKESIRLVRWLLLAGLAVIVPQAVYFAAVLNMENSTTPSEAVVIFRGTEKRIKTGYALAAEGLTPFIVLSPSSAAARSQYDRTYGLPPGVAHLAEAHARTTLENARYTARVIEAHGLKAVTLVTSDYHMPRSLALLRFFLAGKGVAIRTYKVSATEAGNPPVSYRATMAKLLYNEMLECWGSLVEYAARLLSGEGQGTRINRAWGITMLRSLLLLEVNPAW